MIKRDIESVILWHHSWWVKDNNRDSFFFWLWVCLLLQQQPLIVNLSVSVLVLIICGRVYHSHDGFKQSSPSQGIHKKWCMHVISVPVCNFISLMSASLLAYVQSFSCLTHRTKCYFYTENIRCLSVCDGHNHSPKNCVYNSRHSQMQYMYWMNG